MRTKVITPVAVEPVTLQEANLQLRIITDIADATVQPSDPLVTIAITASREHAEHYTGRSFAPVTLEGALDCFPAGDIVLPTSPVTTIDSITYSDTAGATQTLSSSLYVLDTYGLSRCIKLTYGASWPPTRAMPNAVRIQFKAGLAAASLSKAVKQALLIGIELEWDKLTPEDREAYEKARDALLNTAKIWSF
jgi:uncharacterized phiE125 gp8 family phage protein